MVGFFIVIHHILFVISARLLSLKAETPDIQRKRGNFNFLSVSAKNIRLLFQKYKALILKYKPYISKYMACIFRLYKSMKGNDLQNECFRHKKSVFCPPNIGKTGGISFTRHRQLAKVTSKAFFHYSFSTLHNLLIPVLLQEREFFSKFANVIS